MDNADKLRVVLPHWIEHAGEHAAEFREWARRVQPAQAQLLAAAQLFEQANGRLQEALQTLGEAPAHLPA